MQSLTRISSLVDMARVDHLAQANRWVLVVLLLLVAAFPAAAVERPFRGCICSEVLTTPTADPTIYVGGANASGDGTHIGAFTKVTSDVTNVANGWTVGEFTMTVANGDQVTGVYEGFTLFDLAAGTLSWVLDATITGGTGRFTHATGSFVFVASGEFVISPDGSVTTIYTETFDGTIDY